MKIVLAEKPSVARDIAKHLGATKKREGYLEGNGWAVTWAFGHLVELQEPEEYDPSWKAWRLNSLPMVPKEFRLRPRQEESVRRQLEQIKKLFEEGEELICATDAGREGELIFRYIQTWSGCEKKPFKRLWISSLTAEAIAKGFDRLDDGQKFDNLYHAAKCRSEADWIVGLNATRFFTVEYGKRNLLLSIGRVQTPILAMIVGRDREIENFTPEDFWEVHTLCRGTKFRHAKGKIKQREDAKEILEKVNDKALEVQKIERKDEKSNPPLLFDLTELQREMNRRHGFTADQTLKLAQGLYEQKFITYPRTDSRYLTSDLQATIAPLLDKLKRLKPNEIGSLDLERLVFNKRIVDDKKVSDHHAIIPTNVLPGDLSENESKLYEAVLTRLIAVFYPPCVKAVTTVEAIVEQEPFKARGTVLVDPGWQKLYPYLYKSFIAPKGQSKKASAKSEGEALMYDFQKGEAYEHEPSLESFKTSPPKRFTEATLLQLMETAGKIVEDEALKEALKDKGVGTPATRASIIEILIQRKYVERRKKNLISTDSGRLLVSLVPDDRLKSPELTGDWEYRLKQIERGEYDPQAFMTEVETYTREILDCRAENSVNLKNIGPCPSCGAPIIRGRTGYGCSKWRAGCKFVLWEDSFGLTITPVLAREILHNKRSLESHLLQDKKKKFFGFVTIGKRGKVGYEATAETGNANGQESIGSCPACDGDVVEGPKGFGCVNWRSGCKFVIWKSIAQKPISLDLAKMILAHGETECLKGFKSKAGKAFEAKLKIIGGEVKFVFEN